MTPYNPEQATRAAYTYPVWADPLSLATTKGVSVDFFSSGYLDVSVRPVSLRWLCIHHRMTPHYRRRVFPLGDPRFKWLFSALPRLIAAVHVLHRLLVPRHPP